MYCEVYKMQVFHSFEEINNAPEVVIALGTFDGIHLGHQKVMRTAMDKAAELGGSSMVVTFSAHPFSILCPPKEPARLATISQKVRYIADLGIDGLVLLPMISVPAIAISKIGWIRCPNGRFLVLLRLRRRIKSRRICCSYWDFVMNESF